MRQGDTALDKKEEILRAAHALFARAGYAFSMAELAQAVQLKTPSLYSHFGSKREIVSLVMRQEIARSRAAVQTYTDAMGPSRPGRMEKLFWFLLQEFGTDGRWSFWKNMINVDDDALCKECCDEIMAQNRWFTTVLVRCLAEAGAAGSVHCTSGEDTAHLFYSMLLGLLDLTAFARVDSFEWHAYAKSAWRAFCEGIGLQPQP